VDPIFLYAVYRDGQFIGWTLWVSPVAAVANLRALRTD
jgi:hypothetical protein